MHLPTWLLEVEGVRQFLIWRLCHISLKLLNINTVTFGSVTTRYLQLKLICIIYCPNVLQYGVIFCGLRAEIICLKIPKIYDSCSWVDVNWLYLNIFFLCCLGGVWSLCTCSVFCYTGSLFKTNLCLGSTCLLSFKINTYILLLLNLLICILMVCAAHLKLRKHKNLQDRAV